VNLHVTRAYGLRAGCDAATVSITRRAAGAGARGFTFTYASRGRPAHRRQRHTIRRDTIHSRHDTTATAHKRQVCWTIGLDSTQRTTGYGTTPPASTTNARRPALSRPPQPACTTHKYERTHKSLQTTLHVSSPGSQPRSPGSHSHYCNRTAAHTVATLAKRSAGGPPPPHPGAARTAALQHAHPNTHTHNAQEHTHHTATPRAGACWHRLRSTASARGGRHSASSASGGGGSGEIGRDTSAPDAIIAIPSIQ